MAQVPADDPAFMEAININMRVPERLSVGPGHRWGEDEQDKSGRKPPAAYTMHVPERLTYTETPDMSPRPLFTVSKPAGGPIDLDPSWENAPGGTLNIEGLQSPMRRSYSDQSFGRTPPASPTRLKPALAVARHQSGCHVSGHNPQLRCDRPFAADPPVPPHSPPGPPLSVASPQFMLQAAKQLGQQALQRLLQTVGQNYSAIESWSPEEEGGAAVEFLVLRRQVMKMSRRLAALERHSAEHRNTELILFSLLISACLLNAWLWIRR